MDRETYSIAALAEAVGVPRTTINDWLNRYAGFIESEMSGKRRLYSARTVEVLKQVAALRDAGKSAAEIESALTASFGIQPEVAAPKAPEAQPKQAENPVTNDSAEPDAVQLPALRKIEENALELAALIAEMRRREVRSARRSAWLLALIILLLAAFLAAGFGAWKIYAQEKASRQAEMAARQREAAALQETVRAMQKDFAAQLTDAKDAANAERAAAAKRHEMLQKELENEREQRAAESARQLEREKALQTHLENAQQQYEASLAAQNKASAQMLREVKNHAAESEKRLQGEIARAREEIQSLSGELAKKASPTPPPAPAPAPVPAPASQPQPQTLPEAVK